MTELDELVLAYATTIHKAQDSEYPIVVMPFTMSHYVMLQRNLLYTGVTRAKKILVLIGEKKAVAYAVRNETTTARNTKLAERLQEMPVVSNSSEGVPSGNANTARGKNGVIYRMSEQEREQLKVMEMFFLAAFRGICESEYHELQALGFIRRKTFEKDEVIFSTGSYVTKLGLVCSGCVHIEAFFHLGSNRAPVFIKDMCITLCYHKSFSTQCLSTL